MKGSTLQEREKANLIFLLFSLSFWLVLRPIDKSLVLTTKLLRRNVCPLNFEHTLPDQYDLSKCNPFILTILSKGVKRILIFISTNICKNFIIFWCLSNVIHLHYDVKKKMYKIIFFILHCTYHIFIIFFLIILFFTRSILIILNLMYIPTVFLFYFIEFLTLKSNIEFVIQSYFYSSWQSYTRCPA